MLRVDQLRQARQPEGLSLVEVVVATGIVGIVLVAALNTVGMSFRTRKSTWDRLTGPALAQQLMGEVLAMPYHDPQISSGSIGLDSGESGGTSRALFDDVDDYNGYVSNDARSKDGAALPGYAGWRQQVAVAWAPTDVPANTSASETGLKRVTVTITSPTGASTTLVSLKGRKGALAQFPAVDTTVVTWLGPSLRIGAAARSQQWGVHLNNHAADVE